MVKKYFRFLVLISLIIATFFKPSPAYAVSTFDDVPDWHWANNWIERLHYAGVTWGCSQSPPMYCPENTVTRAEMAKFLLASIHGAGYMPPAVGSSTGFVDVSVFYWAGAWIKQLATEGITSGCGDGNYCPDNRVTRAEMAKFLLTAKHGAGYSPPAAVWDTGFNDVSVDYWAASWIKQLAAENITSGCGDGNYCPDSFVTRAEMAKFLVLTFNLPELPKPPMATVYVQNDTGGNLCFEIYGTGIGKKCFDGGKHLYGTFPSGTYNYHVSARCGTMSDSEYYDGEIVETYWCE